jgi:hypothetical protein
MAAAGVTHIGILVAAEIPDFKRSRPTCVLPSHRLDIEVKHLRTNRAALTRQYIRDGLGLRLR